MENKGAVIRIDHQNIGGELVQTVDARTLHEFLESRQYFADWVRSKIDQFSFVENQDYVCYINLCSKGSGGHNRIDYHLTIDMAKELSMVERNEKGKQARQYFIQCEKELRTNKPKEIDFRDPAQLLQIASGLAKANQELVTENGVLQNRIDKGHVINKELKTQIVEDSPKVEFMDSYIDDNEIIGMRRTAKLLHPPAPMKFLDWCSGPGRILYDEGGGKMAYQEWVKAGYLVHEPWDKIINEKTKIGLQPKTTAKGRVWLAKRWKEHNDKSLAEKTSRASLVSREASF